MVIREPQVVEYYWLKKFEPGVLLRGFRAAAALAGCSLDSLTLEAGCKPDYRPHPISAQELEAVQRFGGSPQWVHLDIPGGFVSVGRGNATLWLKVLSGSGQEARRFQVVLENELDLNPKINACMYCGKTLTEPEASFEARMRKPLSSYRSGAYVTSEYLERKVVILRCHRCKSLSARVKVLFVLLPIVPSVFIAPAIPWTHKLGFLDYLITWLGLCAILWPIHLVALSRMGVRLRSEQGSPRCMEMEADGWKHA
ncbi:MAG: hypothetical protein ACM3X4_13490 [Ignavibacteriales bacterium]